MIALFIKMLIGHALADFTGLQGSFLAQAKNHRKPIDGISYQFPLAAHALIHAGFVWYITQSNICAVAEFVSHYLIDYAKNSGIIDFTQDQICHVVMKWFYVLWILIAIN